MRNYSVAIVAALIFGAFSNTVFSEKPYYGFYSSKLGAEWKLLRHTLLSFEIDIPSSWTFGVSGKSDSMVILLYPQSVDLSKVTDNYESIEIGRIHLNQTLDQIVKHSIAGMKLKHPDADVSILPVRNADRRNIIITWISKAGVQMVENIVIMDIKKSFRSVTIRSSSGVAKSNNKVHKKIVDSFSVL